MTTRRAVFIDYFVNEDSEIEKQIQEGPQVLSAFKTWRSAIAAKYARINAKIAKQVDKIWGIYDTDGNDSLDVDEARGFVKDTLTD